MKKSDPVSVYIQNRGFVGGVGLSLSTILVTRLEDLERLDPTDLQSAGLCSVFEVLNEETDAIARWIDVDRQIIHITVSRTMSPMLYSVRTSR